MILLGAALTLAAAVLVPAWLSAGPMCGATGVGLALYRLVPQRLSPASLMFLPMPGIATLLAVRLPGRQVKRRFLRLRMTVLAIFTLSLGGATLIERASWPIAWLAAAGLGIVIAAGGAALSANWRFRRCGARERPDRRRLLEALVPFARHIREAGAEAERSRLALDIHNRLLPRVDRSLRAVEDGQSREVAIEALTAVAHELRLLMQRHQTVTLEIGGLAEALRAELEAASSGGVAVTLSANGQAKRPPSLVELAAYRVGQAAIDNAFRHSGADLISVSLVCGRDFVQVVVTDDGVGIDEVARVEARRRGRLGLSQMSLQAAAVGASLEVSRMEPAGSRVDFAWHR